MFHHSVTNSKLKNKKLQFKLLTWWVNFYFFCFWVTNWRLKNKKIHIELLTWWVHFYFHFWVMNVKLISENNVLIIAVSKWHGLHYSILFFVFSLLCCKYICDIIWVCWILMGYAGSTTYLLTKLPHAGLYKYNGRQIELFYIKWFNCG